MAITKQKKEKILEELKKNLKKAQIVIFINFHGLNVSAAVKLRKLLLNLNTKYLVAKKTIIKKAMEEFNLTGVSFNLEGETALVFSEDCSLGFLKELNNFAQKENIKFLAGIFEKEYIDKNAVLKLASIPSKEILLCQFISVINQPMQGVVVTLNGIIKNLVSILNQIKK